MLGIDVAHDQSRLALRFDAGSGIKCHIKTDSGGVDGETTLCCERRDVRRGQREHTGQL